jgi:hypothetical protein
MRRNDFEESHVEETYVVQPLQRSISPSMDAHAEFEADAAGDIDHRRMFMLDVAAVIVATIMALGPLSVYSIFGS